MSGKTGKTYTLTELRDLYKKFCKDESIYSLAGEFVEWLEEREEKAEREKRRPRYHVY